MAKYAKFAEYLTTIKDDRIRLSFDAIESIIGADLPSSKKYAAWWSNNPSNSVMTKAWRRAGFKSIDVDVVGEKVTFVRERAARALIEPERPGQSPLPMSPLFGSMKGTSFVAEGVDLTAPADADWGKVYDDDYVPPAASYVVQDTTLSVADKIRELDEMGIERAQIAKLLGKRYQHVRNVLVRDQRKAG